MKKLARPYFRVSIRGYYPKDSESGLKATLYVKQESTIGRLIMWLAPFVVKKENL